MGLMFKKKKMLLKQADAAGADVSKFKFYTSKNKMRRVFIERLKKAETDPILRNKILRNLESLEKTGRYEQMSPKVEEMMEKETKKKKEKFYMSGGGGAVSFSASQDYKMLIYILILVGLLAAIFSIF